MQKFDAIMGLKYYIIVMITKSIWLKSGARSANLFTSQTSNNMSGMVNPGVKFA